MGALRRLGQVWSGISIIALSFGLSSARAESEEQSSDPDAVFKVRSTQAYKNGSMIVQQMLEDLQITDEKMLQRSSIRSGAVGIIFRNVHSKSWGAQNLGELLQKREAAAFKAARDAVGYSGKSPQFQKVFDEMLEGATARKIAHDHSRLDNWEIDKHGLTMARVAAEMTETPSGASVPRGTPPVVVGTTVIDFNDDGRRAPVRSGVPFSPNVSTIEFPFNASGGQTVRSR